MNDLYNNPEDLLTHLVAIPSSYPDERTISAFLIRYLRAIGFRVETQTIVRGRTNILATKGDGENAVLFYGHMDTVGITNPAQWNTDPYVLTKKGDLLYGLGAYDMKGGMSAFLSACAVTDAYVKMFLAVDEENISEGAWRAVTQKKRFFRDVALIISAEPNFGLGLNGITTGRTGRCVFDVGFEGKPVHIVDYKTGKDAIEMLAKFVTALYQARDILFPNTRSILQVRKIIGESVGVSVCGTSSIEVEALLDVKTSIADVKRALIRLGAKRVQLKERKTPYLTGYQFHRFRYHRVIADIIRKETGNRMTIHTRTSVGDDNVLATLGVPVITWGPDGGNAHAPNEYVSLSGLVTLTTMYTMLLSRLNNI